MYWPTASNIEEIGNNDLREIVAQVAEQLCELPVIKDRHGNFRSSEDVVRLPGELGEWLYEDKYENVLGEGRTFIDRDWVEKYGGQLEEIGAKEADHQVVIELICLLTRVMYLYSNLREYYTNKICAYVYI